MYAIIRKSYRFLYPNPDSSYVTSVSFKYHKLICCKSMILTANIASTRYLCFHFTLQTGQNVTLLKKRL